MARHELRPEDVAKNFGPDDVLYLRAFEAAARNAGCDRRQIEGLIDWVSQRQHKFQYFTLEQRWVAIQKEMARLYFSPAQIEAMHGFGNTVLKFGPEAALPRSEDAGSVRARIASTELLMKTDFPAYQADKELQSQYRNDLESLGDGARSTPQVSTASSHHVPSSHPRQHAIEQMMGDPRSAYWAKDTGPVIQQEYAQLLAPSVTTPSET